MSYFYGIKVGDKVWSFIENGYETITRIIQDREVLETNNCNYYNLDGLEMENYDLNKFHIKTKAQIVFWDKPEFEIPKKSKIELKENKYYIDLEHNKITDKNRFNKFIDNDLFRNNKKIAEKALKTIKRFTRLLALRDQECEGSKGFEPNKDELYYVIIKEDGKYVVYDMFNLRTYDTIKFKSEADAQKICDILNEGRFDLEGE